jgi:hypothetical protein
MLRRARARITDNYGFWFHFIEHCVILHNRQVIGCVEIVGVIRRVGQQIVTQINVPVDLTSVWFGFADHFVDEEVEVVLVENVVDLVGLLEEIRDYVVVLEQNHRFRGVIPHNFHVR